MARDQPKHFTSTIAATIGLQSKRRSLGYAIAITGPMAAVAVRWLLVHLIGDVPLYIFFYPVIFAAAVVGGTRPGLVATFLSAFASVWFFIEPRWTLALGTPAQAIGLGIFLIFNFGVSFLGGRLRQKSEALRESEARLRLANRVTRIGSFEWNIETGVNDWSPELEIMYGLQPGQFARTEPAWEMLVHPDDLTFAKQCVERALHTFQPQEAEWRVIWPDGSVHWIVARFQAFANSHGKAARLIGVNFDITERKKAIEGLRQREEWFRTLANAIPQLTWIAHADGNIFWFNDRCLEYTGLGLEQLKGSGWHSVHDPENLPAVLERWRHAIKTGESVTMEFPLRRSDGQFRNFLTIVVPLKDGDGKVALWFGTHTDVTELRKNQAALRRQARLIDLAPAATLVRRLDGTITFWSDGAERLYGWTKEESIGRRTMDLMRTEFPEPFEKIVAKLRSGIPWNAELRQYTRSGRQVIVQSYWLAELDADGKFDEFLESNTDVTERKRLQEHLEEEVEARTKEVRETLAELEHMSYSMIHDMRAPLRAMQNYALILEDECPECRRPPASEYLKRIRQSSIRMDRLLTDALNYNKLARQEAPTSPIEIGTLLRSLIQTYPNLEPTFADISIEFDELIVLGNESLLTQCFGNLLGNAVKFVAPGVHPSVRIWAEEVQNDNSFATGNDDGTGSAMMRIFVEDNGIGIPKDAERMIFGMFQRMHGPDEYRGTGIGLAIVKKAVERMHGHIGFESEIGKGTKFWIELPCPVASSRKNFAVS
jgi:PAS domain S-box-containing protein